MKIPYRRLLQMLSCALAGTIALGSCQRSDSEQIDTPSENCVIDQVDTTALVHAGCMFSNNLAEGDRFLQWYLFTKKPDGTASDHFIVIGVPEKEMGRTFVFDQQKQSKYPWNFVYYRKTADSSVINYVANSAIIGKDNCTVESGALRAEYDAGRKHILISFDIHTKDGNRINGFYKGAFRPDKFNFY